MGEEVSANDAAHCGNLLFDAREDLWIQAIWFATACRYRLASGDLNPMSSYARFRLPKRYLTHLRKASPRLHQ